MLGWAQFFFLYFITEYPVISYMISKAITIYEVISVSGIGVDLRSGHNLVNVTQSWGFPSKAKGINSAGLTMILFNKNIWICK